MGLQFFNNCYNWIILYIFYNLPNNNHGDIMRKEYTFFSFICFILIGLTVFSYYLGKNYKENTTVPEIKTAYVMKLEDGSVNLYLGNVFIETINEIDPHNLPLTDIDNLKSGIILNSYDEVQSLIEDFDG